MILTWKSALTKIGKMLTKIGRNFEKSTTFFLKNRPTTFFLKNRHFDNNRHDFWQKSAKFWKIDNILKKSANILKNRHFDKIGKILTKIGKILKNRQHFEKIGQQHFFKIRQNFDNNRHDFDKNRQKFWKIDNILKKSSFWSICSTEERLITCYIYTHYIYTISCDKELSGDTRQSPWYHYSDVVLSWLWTVIAWQRILHFTNFSDGPSQPNWSIHFHKLPINLTPPPPQ